jgi:hypothetical protein
MLVIRYNETGPVLHKGIGHVAQKSCAVRSADGRLSACVRTNEQSVTPVAVNFMSVVYYGKCLCNVTFSSFVSF